MSRSASPSIATFFKAQRKRPLAGEKDDVVMSASKKLLLEEGITIKKTGFEETNVSTRPATPPPAVAPAPVEKKKKAVVVRGRKPTDESITPSSLVVKEGINTVTVEVPVEKKRKLPAASVPKAIEESLKQAKSTVQDAPEKIPTEAPVEKKKKKAVDKVSNANEESAKPSTAAPEASKTIAEKSDQTGEKKALQEKSGGPSASTVGCGSPVKFLKVGSLSPMKKTKMSTEQVAKLLKRKTKLKDLKNALQGINQCAQKLQEFRRTVDESNAKMSPAKTNKEEPSKAGLSSTGKHLGMSPGKFYSPSPTTKLNADLSKLSASKMQSPSKLINMNNKVKKRLFDEQANTSDGERTTVVPAYQRFHALAQKTPSETGQITEENALPLPYRFRVLKELFISVETVVGIMKGRKEMITFPKLKIGVMELFRKVALREKHIAQIVTVLPNCYILGVERVGTEHHITFNVTDTRPSTMLARRKEFHANLIDICLQRHKSFLLNLVPPIVVPADKQISRWHPKFKLDEIPEITPDENALPVKPAAEKACTAREVLAKAQHILEANPRMKQAVKNLLDKPTELVVVGETPKEAPAKLKSSTSVKALKGVSESLLEKIRNREREKLLKEMTRSPAESKKLQMMKRLPQFIQIIHNMMITEKKIALPMDTVVDRVSHTIQNMACVDADAHIRLLVTILPKWAKIHKLSHSIVEYLKIDKNIDTNNLLQELGDITKQHSS